jgi:AraC-like DNA-binding protein
MERSYFSTKFKEKYRLSPKQFRDGLIEKTWAWISQWAVFKERRVVIKLWQIKYNWRGNQKKTDLYQRQATL